MRNTEGWTIFHASQHIQGPFGPRRGSRGVEGDAIFTETLGTGLQCDLGEDSTLELIKREVFEVRRRVVQF
jgi:hypothetical protein